MQWSPSFKSFSHAEGSYKLKKWNIVKRISTLIGFRVYSKAYSFLITLLPSFHCSEDFHPVFFNYHSELKWTYLLPTKRSLLISLKSINSAYIKQGSLNIKNKSILQMVGEYYYKGSVGSYRHCYWPIHLLTLGQQSITL